MRIKMTGAPCSYCKDPLSDWDYRFQGRHYCKTCYLRFFELTTCSLCREEKRIFIFLSKRICKHCLVKDKPCIRCGKTEYKHGLISKYGPVCASCSIYFREYKQCSSCQKVSYDIVSRTLPNGSKKLLCTNCYNKTLPICSRCHRQALSYKIINDKNVCKKCATESDRVCKQCNRLFPAGRGRICKDCSYRNMLNKRTEFYVSLLSAFTSSLFQHYSSWLESRRGVLYAALHIQKYYPFFRDIDAVAQDLHRFPTYIEILKHLTVAKSRKYLLVTLFLQDTGKITLDKSIQEEYANLDMIDRLTKIFPQNDTRHTMIVNYCNALYEKQLLKKITIRSIRLALTPAVKFLQYRDYFNENTIDDNILHGYLWVYSGQRNALGGFINFLNKDYGLLLHSHKRESIVNSPHYSKKQLKQKLIQLLKNPLNDEKYKRQLFRIALGYCHNLDLPNNAFIDYTNIKNKKNGTRYIRLVGKELYLPTDIVRYLA